MSDFDFDAYTQMVINAIGPKASPRIKEVLPIFIKHLHAACIEADVTTTEFVATTEMLMRAGQVSSEKRNEVLLCADIIGIESLVNTLDQTRDARKAASAKANGANGANGEAAKATSSAILGPFYRHGVPEQPNHTSIIRYEEPGNPPYTHLFGTVYGADGKPLPNAILDVWHDAPDGLYDAQTPHKPEYHCRGKFRTDANGQYDLVCLKPTAYPIPYDHTAGDLLKLMDRHPMRPAHIHFWIEAAGHVTLITQIFNSDSDYLTDDSVFAVKTDNVVEFKPVSKDYKPPAGLEGKMVFELQQDFHLQSSA